MLFLEVQHLEGLGDCMLVTGATSERSKVQHRLLAQVCVLLQHDALQVIRNLKVLLGHAEVLIPSKRKLRD